MKASLLIEMLTEELPPRSLARLEQAFAEALCEGLALSRLLESPTYDSQKILATPRRLAVVVSQVLDAASDRQIEVTGPSVKAPPEAVAGFAKKHGVDVKALEQRDTPKGKIFVANVTSKGATLDSVLGSIVNAAIKRLPVPKLMRWGAGEAQFVRPVHGLVMLHGRRVVPGKVLGLEAGNITRGHRFMGASEIALRSAEEYEERLLKDGAVIADFAKRRDEIERQLLDAAKREGGSLGEHADQIGRHTSELQSHLN